MMGKRLLFLTKIMLNLLYSFMSGMAQENTVSKNWLRWQKNQVWFSVKVRTLLINQPFKRFSVTVFIWVSLNGIRKFTRETINRLLTLSYGSNANKSYLGVTACALKALNINLHSAD